MTKAQDQLNQAMLDAVASGKWTVLDGQTIRYTRTIPAIPGWRNPYTSWKGEWDQHVFLSTSRILGVDRGPWTDRQDKKITYKDAMRALLDPEAYLD